MNKEKKNYLKELKNKQIQMKDKHTNYLTKKKKKMKRK